MCTTIGLSRDAFTLGCPGSVPDEALQFVGTGTELEIYGDIVFDGWQNGYVIHVTGIVPSRCTTSAEDMTWSNFKRLYR